MPAYRLRGDESDYDPAAPPRILPRAEAFALGFTEDAIRHRLATGAWRRVLPRTYLTSDTFTWPDRQYAAVAFAGAGALLTGAAALADLGLRSVTRPDRVCVLVPTTRCPRSVGWIQLRPSSRPVQRAVRPGPACATVGRAVADEALRSRRIDDVRMLVAETVRRSFCSLDELVAELSAGPQRGSKFLRQAIDEVGGGAWSAPEARAATMMRRAGLPAFEQNARIELPTGKYLIVDFLWRALCAVLEIDSDAHHALAGDADRTTDRHLALTTLGFSVVHRTPRQIVTDPGGFTDDVGRWLVGLAAARRPLA